MRRSTATKRTPIKRCPTGMRDVANGGPLPRGAETTAEATINVSTDGIILSCNARFSEFVATPVERLLGRDAAEFISPEDRDAFRALLRECSSHPVKRRLEFRSPARRPVYLTGSALFQSDGVSLCLVAADLIEPESSVRQDELLRRTEPELRESEGSYRGLFESIDQGFCVIEVLFDEDENPVDYRFLIVNPAFEKQTGIKNAVGRRARDIVPGLEEHWFQTYGKIALTGERMDFEHRAEPLQRYYEVSAWRVGEPAERKVAILFSDLTERKRAEENIRRSREDLDRAQAVAQIGSWRLDTLRNVLTWSAETHRIFGVPEDTPMSYEFFLSLVHPEDRDYVDAQWAAALRGEPYDIEHRIVAGDRVKWVREKAYLEFDPGGRLLGGFGITQDITQRKQAEDELKKAKEAAEQANRAKDKFLAALSHELRTPLTPILAGSQLLTRRGDLPANAYSTIELIKRNVEIEARLIDDLLDLSRVMHGKIQLCTERIDVHRVIKNAVDICRPRLAEKGQELELYLNAKQASIEGDVSRLQQCFWNLIINSVKFTPEYGRITIETENQGKDVVIKVADTGRGIDRALLPKLFSAFEQGETGQSGGLGLGLSITKGLVELHHGTISAFSEGNGRGSTFTISLPVSAADADADADAERAQFQPPAMSKSILLVEDNEDTGLLVKAVLDGGGHRVHFATNVVSALRAAEKEKFDLLLCDIGLPDGSGLDVVSSLRKCKAIDKAVAMTGYGMEDDVEKCRRAGFDTHLTKPIDIEELERLIAVL